MTSATPARSGLATPEISAPGSPSSERPKYAASSSAVRFMLAPFSHPPPPKVGGMLRPSGLHPNCFGGFLLHRVCPQKRRSASPSETFHRLGRLVQPSTYYNLLIN